VRYDDRLLTVLNQPAGDRHDVAVRWRQLVDLIARAGPNGGSPIVTRAIEEIRMDSAKIEEDLRAAAARAVAALPLPMPLLEYFASDRIAVSAPVLAAAALQSDQWRALLGVADEETRRFIETIHPELKAELPLELTEMLAEPPAPQPATTVEERSPEPSELPDEGASPSLHEVVERIERRRRARLQQRRERGPGAPVDFAPALFRWECGPTGDINWVEGAPRGPLVGRTLARSLEGGDRVDPQVLRAFAMRVPFRDAALTFAGDGVVAGDWKISGIPAFEPSDGRFAGYRGVALRDEPSEPFEDESGRLLPDPDSLRELVHEIKTPLNAIIGFAEIIDGQYLGPADRRYRERATEIVSHARALLAAIDDLDFAAKVHSDAPTRTNLIDLGELTERMAPSLMRLAEARGVEIDASRLPRNCTAAVEPELAERLIHRMCSAVIESGETGDRLRLAVDQTRDECRVSITLPKSLTKLSSEALLGNGRAKATEAGFSLRLARGLARIAGGDLTGGRGSVALSLPRA
jgi:hypothetical protein